MPLESLDVQLGEGEVLELLRLRTLALVGEGDAHLRKEALDRG